MPNEKLINGDFESGGTGWTVNNPTGNGAPAFTENSVSFNTGNESTYGDSIEQTFTAPIGTTQTVTMDLFENNGGVATHSFLIEILDSNGTVISSHAYDVPNNTTLNVSFTFVPTTATSTIRITNSDSTNSNTTDGKVDNVSIVCFACGTLIETINGAIPVEDLTEGMLIKTYDGSFKPLRLALSRAIAKQELSNEKLRPVCILAGALGSGLPKSDLRVSRQHRMVVASKISERMFDQRNVFLTAFHLTMLPGIFVDTEIKQVTYFHLVFDKHEVIFANGAPSESFYPGPVAIKALTDEARTELFTLFPKLKQMPYQQDLAYFTPRGVQQRKLISRRIQNNKPLVYDFPQSPSTFGTLTNNCLLAFG